MSDAWFRPKIYGYGATPTNWKGWMAVAGFVAGVLAITFPLMLWPEKSGGGPTAWQVIVWLAAMLILTAAFVGLTRAKTDGQWKWRWGK